MMYKILWIMDYTFSMSSQCKILESEVGDEILK
jgi:hypothetical protein